MSSPSSEQATAAESAVGYFPTATDYAQALALAQAKPDPVFHWIWLTISTVVVLLAITMSIENRERVALPGMTWPVPELCTTKAWLGIACPGCGMTRSFISAGHGRWTEAWSYNVIGIPLFWITVFQIPYRAIQLWRIRRQQPEFQLGTLATAVFLLILLVMVATWVQTQWAMWLG